MDNPKEITKEIAGRNAIYAMLASNSYHDDKKRYFPVEKAGWVLVDRDGDPTSEPSKESKLTGFAYDIYEEQTTNKTVIAFRGTDSKQDWFLSNLALPFSIPYKQAGRAVQKYLKNNASRNLIVVGHSLGGGMALSTSVRFGVPAITFDPSPRIFDGIGDHHETAMRIVIYQRGEILTAVRERWSKIKEIVNPEDIYECSYDFNGENAHKSDILAFEMARHGADSNAKVKAILDAM